MGSDASLLLANDRDLSPCHSRILELVVRRTPGTYVRTRKRGTTTNKAKNVGTIERSIRIVGGGLAAIIGLFILLPSPVSAVSGGIGVVLVLLGIDFVITGLTGYCPLYHRLGWSTASSQDSRPTDLAGHA